MLRHMHANRIEGNQMIRFFHSSKQCCLSALGQARPPGDQHSPPLSPSPHLFPFSSSAPVAFRLCSATVAHCHLFTTGPRTSCEARQSKGKRSTCLLLQAYDYAFGTADKNNGNQIRTACPASAGPRGFDPECFFNIWRI